jgi:hypothetical protein
VADAEVGAALACAPVAWAPDVVESFLYRAPQSTTYAWTLDGRPVADASTLTAAGPGDYACTETATNGAGSTAAAAGSFHVPVPDGGAVAPPPQPAPGGDAGPSSSAAPSAATAAPPPGAPRSATPRVTHVSFDPRRGVAALTVRVDRSGTLTLSGREVVRREATAAAAGVARLKVASKGGALKALVASGRVKVHVSLRFVPTDGPTATAARAIVLRRRSSP